MQLPFGTLGPAETVERFMEAAAERNCEEAAAFFHPNKKRAIVLQNCERAGLSPGLRVETLGEHIEGDAARVEVVFTLRGESQNVTVELLRVDGEWRILDI